MLGWTKGTRHYIQYQLTDEEGWQDLLFQNDEGDLQGLWCSRSYTAANNRILELMTECDTVLEQYRIVRRTWDETILQPTGPASNATDEDATMEADLESQVGEVPDTGDEPTEVINPLVK